MTFKKKIVSDDTLFYKKCKKSILLFLHTNKQYIGNVLFSFAASLFSMQPVTTE